MNFTIKSLVLFSIATLCLTSCGKDEDTTNGTSTAKMTFQFEFDETQERLDNFGNPSNIPNGNAAQTPDFNKLSAFYIELVPTKFTNIRDGAVVYEAKTQTAASSSNFDEAVIFDQAIVSDEGIEFLELDLSEIPKGTYEYARVSVTYQNANVKFNLLNLPAPLPENVMNQKGTIASFIGINTYVSDHTIFDKTETVNGDVQQGYWAFESQMDFPYQSYYEIVNPQGFSSGQAPPGNTTVVNPLAEFGIELPFGSCIVTGKFETPLVITGDEQEDVNLKLAFSVNNSFEWTDTNGNGTWDFDVETGTIEPLVDMGLRGLIVKR